jgi:hypothetical protein
MARLDVYVCTKSKCTAKQAQVKLCSIESEPGSYNGPALLDAVRLLVEREHLQAYVCVHEVACMAGCPVGPRADMRCEGKRVMYFNRQRPTGRADLVTWQSVESVEAEIMAHLRDWRE